MSHLQASGDPLDVALAPLPVYGWPVVAIGGIILMGALVLSAEGIEFGVATVLLLESIFIAAAVWPARALGGIVIVWFAVGLLGLSLLGAVAIVLIGFGTGFLVAVAVVGQLVVIILAILFAVQLLVIVKRIPRQVRDRK